MHSAGRRGSGGFGPGPGFGGPGGFGDFGGGGRRGLDGEGRRERMLEGGDLRLLALHVLRQRPSHGYEVIKAIEDLAGGHYSPSPGTVYPTLAMLEDLGHVELADTSGSRKQYRITVAGEEALAAQQEVLDRVLARLQHLGGSADARRSPAIHRAMHNLKLALQLRFAGEAPSEEAVRRIAEAIDRAAVEIERS
ncbi:PadR family transcriptional regulator [Rubrivivax sp. JA1055]|nr:PadR family transcriptional regulator [Rubrivivax sp. JA1029]MCC9596142.1 PadR family transcriptional regulator [Rubrivivax sp. JA1055]MCC9647516.1 PadR family transcriptional regulator [Rubrivivax sp. JA1029]